MKIKLRVTLLIIFVTITNSCKSQTYDFVDKMPTYKNSADSSVLYIFRNFKLPQYFDIEKYPEYRELAVIKFIVNTDGSLDSLRVSRSTNIAIVDSIYINLFKTMGRWEAGELDGKKVRVRISYPIRIRLNR